MGNEADETPHLREDAEESHQLLHSEESVDLSVSSHATSQVEVDVEKNKGCCRKVLDCLQMITVEPVLLLDILGWSIQSALTTNLLLSKVCHEQQHSEAICANMSAYEKIQVEVQREVTLINMYKELLTALPNIFFVLFIGSWSDKYGRKVPLTLPVFGSFLSALIILVNAYWIELPAMYILFSGIPQVFTGGFITMLMAAFSYITDITKVRARTTRIAIMDFSFVLGFPLGIWLSNWIYYEFSYLGIYGISAALFLLAIVYSMVRIEDTRGPYSKIHLENTEFAETPNNMLRDLFDIDNVKSIMAACTKLRPNKGRGKILGLMISMFASIFTYGVSNIAYLFVKRKFGWDYNQYVHLGLVKSIIGSIGISIILPLLSYRLQVHDALLGIIGCTSSILSVIITGLAPSSWYLYLGACVGSLGGLSAILNRAILSKIVPDGEVGKIFAMTASFEAAVPLMSSPFFTLVYNNTIDALPGAVYLVSTAFYIVPLIIFLWIFLTRHLSAQEYHIHEEEDIPDIQ